MASTYVWEYKDGHTATLVAGLPQSTRFLIIYSTTGCVTFTPPIVPAVDGEILEKITYTYDGDYPGYADGFDADLYLQVSGNALARFYRFYDSTYEIKDLLEKIPLGRVTIKPGVNEILIPSAESDLVVQVPASGPCTTAHAAESSGSGVAFPNLLFENVSEPTGTISITKTKNAGKGIVAHEGVTFTLVNDSLGYSEGGEIRGAGC